MAHVMGNPGSVLVGFFLPLLLLLSQPQQDGQGLLLHENQAEETGKVLALLSFDIRTIFKSRLKSNSRLKFVTCCLMWQ